MWINIPSDSPLFKEGRGSGIPVEILRHPVLNVVMCCPVQQPLAPRGSLDLNGIKLTSLWDWTAQIWNSSIFAENSIGHH